MIWDVSSDFPTEICGILITKLGDIHNYAYIYTYIYTDIDILQAPKGRGD